jgi:hypothetical protein
MKNPLPYLLLLGAALLGGCSTVQSRIEEKSAVFNSLTPEEQARLRQGVINVGDTSDMVYIAMGKPDDVRERTSASGIETTWVYKAYYHEYEGSRFLGYRRHVYFDPRIKAYRVYYEPVRQEVYSEREEEVATVVFKDGRVAVIEQAKS